MAKRRRLLLRYTFSYDQSTAIPIYIQNMIKALNTLPDEEKPFLYVLYTKEAPMQDIWLIKYPYLRAISASNFGNLWQRIVNKFMRKFFHGNYLYYHGINKYKIDCIYPHFGIVDAALKRQSVAWIADFQQCYYPDFFPEDDYKRIMNNLSHISQSEIKLVLSSQAAYDDYKKFYPEHTNDVVLLRFTSFIPEMPESNWPDIKKKFSIHKPYFIISNQFWPHKNHLTVIQAVQLLHKQYNGELPFELLITGKPYSHRNPKIFEELNGIVTSNNLQYCIRFLGFLERQEQLQLIKKSYAVIQPSLFEGWSTLVEECKAMNKYVILSDLPVHREQMTKNVSFFSPLSAEHLAEIIDSYISSPKYIHSINYQDNINQYARDILKIFRD